MNKNYATLMLALALTFVGCAKEADWTKLKPGMTQAQVRKQFGPPERQSMVPNQEIWIYADGKEVYFEDGLSVESFGKANNMADPMIQELDSLNNANQLK